MFVQKFGTWASAAGGGGTPPASDPFWRMEFSHGMPVPVIDATGDADENAVDFSHGMPVPVIEATD